MPVIRARIAVAVLTLSVTLPPAMANASGDAADLCTQAAARASQESGVPYDVLLAISVVETGRNARPWPWTINLGGDGHWLDSASSAETLVDQALAEGLTNIDLGCFQLNYRWHAPGFASVADMLDPDRNALYAAEYLAKQFAETGDWALAAAAYHSGTPEYAERYQARFETAWSAVSEDAPAPVDDAVVEERLNRFPLLLAGQTGRGGSLVPSLSGGTPLIGAP